MASCKKISAQVNLLRKYNYRQQWLCSIIQMETLDVGLLLIVVIVLR